MLSDVLGAPVSTGFLAGLVPEAAGALVPFVDKVLELLSVNAVLHADETSIRGLGAKLVAARDVDHLAHVAGLPSQTGSGGDRSYRRAAPLRGHDRP
jgi:hypothetical protein